MIAIDNIQPQEITIIVGGLKCGTTSLFNYLSEHPQIIPSTVKEIHYFSHSKNYSKGVDWYYSMWHDETIKLTDKTDGRLMALEASPTYTMMPFRKQVVKRIADMAQTDKIKFRFIYIIRNPVSRIESHIRHWASTKSLTQEEVDSFKKHKSNIAFSMYAFQIDQYVEVFGRSSVHLMTLEDLKKHPREELRKVCSFLEIDENHQFSNIDTAFNSGERFTLPPEIYKLRSSSLLSPIVGMFPAKFRHQIRSLLARNFKSEINPTLSNDEKRKVVQELKADLLRLSTEYGVDISRWNLEIE